MEHTADFSLHSCDCISVWDSRALHLHLPVPFGHLTISFLNFDLKPLFALSDDNIFGNSQPLGIPVRGTFWFCHYSYSISDSYGD